MSGQVKLIFLQGSHADSAAWYALAPIFPFPHLFLRDHFIQSLQPLKSNFLASLPGSGKSDGWGGRKSCFE